MPPETLATRVNAFERHLSPARTLALLDLGSGTGRFSPALPERFGGPVCGVEPSEKMRAVAVAEAAHPAVSYLAGQAESLPLLKSTFDGAVVFFVWHHVEDKARAARELTRVLKAEGRVLVRTNSSDRMPDLWWYRYFPRAEEVDRTIYCPLEEVVASFGEAGMRFLDLDEVDHLTAHSLAEDFARLQLRALSTFEHMSDEEVDEGFRAIEAGLRATPDSGPVRARGDLLVFGCR
jgi:ubiquinone/menaquinone biosynthesis C-methylase UbiE